MKRCAFVLAGVLASLVLLGGIAEAQGTASSVPPAVSRAGRFVLGAGLGIMGGSVDDEGLALGVNGDYYFTNELSVGPLLQMGFTSDLFQLGLSAQVKYTMDVRQIPALKPHVEAGIGFVYADLENGRSDDDVSFLIPVGFGLEYRLSRRVSLDTTFYLNFTDLDVKGKNDNMFVTWLIGARFPF
jgi:hypothetical protein